MFKQFALLNCHYFILVTNKKKLNVQIFFFIHSIFFSYGVPVAFMFICGVHIYEIDFNHEKIKKQLHNMA